MKSGRRCVSTGWIRTEDQMTELTGKEVQVKKQTGAQRLSMGIGHALGRYKLGRQRRAEDIKWDFACLLHDYLASTVVDFPSDAFMEAAGYKKR